MCYFMSDNHADPTIIKISEKEKSKFGTKNTHPASVGRYFIQAWNCVNKKQKIRRQTIRARRELSRIWPSKYRH